jgi:hypothetical protein
MAGWARPNPAGGEDPEKVAVAKESHIATRSQGSVDDAAGPRSYLVDGFPFWDRARPDRPVGLHGSMAAVVRPS